jgi:histone H3/H4
MDEKSGDELRLNKNGIREISHDVVDRISGEACNRIALQEERRIKKKVRLASIVAERAGRKTVREEDLMVVETILEEELPP